MYGIDDLAPEVKKHFNVGTFGLDPLAWLYKLLGRDVVEEHYKKFWSSKRENYGDNALLQYLNATFNPLLNQKLNRPEDHPTFRDMLEHAYTPHVMKDPTLSKHIKDDFILRQVQKGKRYKTVKPH